MPAPYRTILETQQQPLIVTRSLTDSCLQGQGAQRINQIVEVLDTMDSLSPDVHLLQAVLASAQEMKIDSEGRIMMPSEWLDFAELKDTVIFAGVGRLFEIWNPETYRTRAEQQRQTIKKNGLPPLVLKPKKPTESGGA